MFESYNDLVSIGELCEMLQIGKTAAYNLLRSGQIKSFRNGRDWKIPRIAVEEYVFHSSGLYTGHRLQREWGR